MLKLLNINFFLISIRHKSHQEKNYVSIQIIFY